MSEVKHTPGPWFVPKGPFITGLSVDTQADQATIPCPGSGGAMSYTSTVCKLDWYGTPEWEANARLIAAAPDLLSQLKRLAHAYVSLMESGRDRIIELGGSCDEVDVMEAGNPWLRDTKAAIAKAEGR